MAIVINGSGTLSGLAVGGLPDGTVDSGTLATDSVIAAKLKSDAITALDLPAGSVLQVVSDTNASQLTLSSAGSWVDTGLSLNITPSSTSSKIHIQYTFPNIYFSSGGAGVSFRIMRGSTSVFTPGIIYERYSSQSGMHLGYANIAIDSPSSTSAVTYKIQAAQYNSTVVRINDNGGSKDTLIAMEIAG